MARKKKTEEPDEEEQFHVEVITRARVSDDGEWEYYVKWAGYESDYDTWEPEENVLGCERLLRGFWADVGVDNEDYDEGYTVYATPTWIAKEKAFFAKNFGARNKKPVSKEKNDSDQESSDDPIVISSKRKKKAQKTGTEPKKKRVPEKSSRQEPIASSSSLKSVKKGPKTTTRLRVADSSDEDSDAPLAVKTSATSSKSKKHTEIIEIEDSEPESSAAKSEKPPKLTVKIPKRSDTSGTAIDKGKGKAKDVAQSPARSSEEQSDGKDSLFDGEDPSSPDVSLSAKEPPSGLSTSQAAQAKPAVQPTAPARPAPARQFSTTSNVPTKPVERRGIKQIPIEVQSRGRGIGIPTKQRLAQHAREPVAPSKLSARNALANLSFKKNTVRTGSGTSNQDQTASRKPSGSSTLQTNDSPQPMDIVTDVPEMVQSPVSTEPMASPRDAQLRPTALERRPVIPLPRRQVTFQHSPVEPMAEAEQLLQDIMPTDLAAPMDESAADSQNVAAASIARPSAAKQLSLGRNGKWRWSGELFVDADSGRAQRLCNVSLYDITDPRPGGLRFNMLLTSADSIRIHKLHDTFDIYMILRACTAISQYAKLGPQEEVDKIPIKSLASHMRRQRTFSYVRLNMDSTEVALLIVFPTISELCKLLGVPPDMIGGSTMLAALVPWELKHNEYEYQSWRLSRQIEANEPPLDPSSLKLLRRKDGKLVNDPPLNRALRILRFPKTLIEFLSTNIRPYCVWHSPADGTKDDPGYDTVALRVFLDAFKANDVGHRADVRVIFVHAGALATLHKLPALSERRKKRLDIRFYMYGSHESVHPERWGVREIFPLGGVVTFTPSAVVEDIVGTYELIRKIDEHPLWQCYIIPSTVAMLAKLTCQGQHPLGLFDKGEFLLDGILKLVEEGTISLLRAPPLSKHPMSDNDPAMRWVGQQFKIMRMDARGILEECIRTAAEQYVGVEERDLPEAIQREIVQDLWNLQMQPAIMDEFRRLVVVKGRSDRHLSDERDGVECVLLSQFDFRDDFFKVDADT